MRYNGGVTTSRWLCPMTCFYVKGSYVLDLVFARNCAHDIDVFHLRGHQPTRDEILRWIQEHKLPPAPNGIVEPTPVDDVDACDGGGHPVFNVDRWHIRDDGNLYTLRETSEPRDALDVIWGAPIHRTLPVLLRPDDARAIKIEIIRPLSELPNEPESVILLKKALRKVREHSELHDPDVVAQVNEEVRRRTTGH